MPEPLGVVLTELPEVTFGPPDVATELPEELPPFTGPAPATGEVPPTTVALPGAPFEPLGSTTVTADLLEVPAELPTLLETEVPGAEPAPGEAVPVVTSAEPPSTAEDSL